MAKDYRRKLNYNFVHEEDPEQSYKDVSRQIKKSNSEQTFRGRGRGGRGQARSSYQSQRTEMFRKSASKVTENDLSQELRLKLFPGVKDGQSAAQRLEAYNTERAITLTITTRAIGFSSFNIFQCIYEFNNVPIRGTVNQLYRVGLAALECKIIIANREVRQIQDVTDDYQRPIMNNDFVIATKAVVILPDQISSVLTAVGNIKVNEKMYVPKVGRNNYTRHNLFIPQSEQVTFSNLRQTVLILANPATPEVYRRRFYAHNPIPETTWEGGALNPILTNPDDIMPDDYGIEDLENDIEDLRPKLNFLNKKAPKYFSKAVSYEPSGTKSMLVCNDQGLLKAPDLNEGEAMIDYFQRRIVGDIDEFFNIEHLTVGEQLEGVLCLLGESPAHDALKYPIYIMRDRRTCCETSALRYKSAKNIYNNRLLYEGKH